MKTELRKYTQPVTLVHLPALLRGDHCVNTEGTGISVDLSPVHNLTGELLKELAQAAPQSNSAWDRELAPVLHRALQGLPRRLTSDLSFWHWMAISQFPGFVLGRWKGIPDIEADTQLTPSLGGRFLGSRSLQGISRNALARLWWVAETLVTPEGDYGCAIKALERQDLFQAIFERRLGLHAPAAKACLAVFAESPPSEFRDQIKKLNHHLSTLVLETLDQAAVERLLVH